MYLHPHSLFAIADESVWNLKQSVWSSNEYLTNSTILEQYYNALPWYLQSSPVSKEEMGHQNKWENHNTTKLYKKLLIVLSSLSCKFTILIKGKASKSWDVWVSSLDINIHSKFKINRNFW